MKSQVANKEDIYYLFYETNRTNFPIHLFDKQFTNKNFPAIMKIVEHGSAKLFLPKWNEVKFGKPICFYGMRNEWNKK